MNWELYNAVALEIGAEIEEALELRPYQDFSECFLVRTWQEQESWPMDMSVEPPPPDELQFKIRLKSIEKARDICLRLLDMDCKPACKIRWIAKYGIWWNIHFKVPITLH